MPPAKRAPSSRAAATRSGDGSADSAVPEVAKAAAPRKTSARRAPAKSTATKAAAAKSASTTRAATTTASKSAAKATRAAEPTGTTRVAKAATQVATEAAKSASGTAARAVSDTATRVGHAVGSARTPSGGSGAAKPRPSAATPELEPTQPQPTDFPAPTAPRDHHEELSAFRSKQDAGEVHESGRAVRKQIKRADLGLWSPPPGRPEAIDLITGTNADRIPSLIPLRWTRMLESPFAYLRGAAAVMAFDLAGSPTSGLHAQICGDAHVANFGLFASRERQQVIDLNDFDESLSGPWEFDVKRLATSIVVAGKVAGVKTKACRTAVSDAVRVYRKVVHALAELPILNAWSASLEGDLSKLIGLDDLAPVLKAVYGKARKNTSVRAAQRMATKLKDGTWQFVTNPPELTRLPEAEASVILAGLDDYAKTLPAARRVLLRRFRPVDVALRVGGLGSIGMRTYAVLLHGNGENDPLVLQVKESRVPSIAGQDGMNWIGIPEPDRHQGERTVAAQQLMQTASDPMLGWTTIEDRPYLVRQFRDMKGGVDATTLKKDQIDDYGRLVGALLARAHCRSLDPRLLAGYLGNGEQVDGAMIDFALSYAEQTEKDHAALVEAADRGLVPTI